jgi:hypothetical protein
LGGEEGGSCQVKASRRKEDRLKSAAVKKVVAKKAAAKKMALLAAHGTTGIAGQ